jgi:hypothetical protein
MEVISANDIQRITLALLKAIQATTIFDSLAVVVKC